MYQLDLSEPANQNAIHGLTRWASWSAVRHADHEVSLRHVLLGHQGYPFCLELEASYRLRGGPRPAGQHQRPERRLDRRAVRHRGTSVPDGGRGHASTAAS